MSRFPIILLLVALLVACAPSAPTSAPDKPTAKPPVIIPSGDEPISVTPGGNANPVPDNQYAPQPGDSQLQEGPAFIEESSLLILESYPLQFVLSLSGSLPDPCHHLRAVINPPDTDNKINIDVYTVVDPNLACIQVIEPFQTNLPLGSFPTGHYTVWMNGEKLAEFDA